VTINNNNSRTTVSGTQTENTVTLLLQLLFLKQCKKVETIQFTL